MEPISQINLQIEQAKKQPWFIYIVYALAVFFGFAFIFFMYERFKPNEPINDKPIVLAEATAIVGVKKTTVAGPKQLEVYSREDLLKKTLIPPVIASNKANEFITTAQLPTMPYGGQSVVFVNYTTGKSGVIVQATPRPKVEFSGQTNLIAAAGASTRGNFIIGGIEQPVVRLGPIQTGVFGVAGMLGAGGIAAAGIAVRW
jgi:hypothetical protein